LISNDDQGAAAPSLADAAYLLRVSNQGLQKMTIDIDNLERLPVRRIKEQACCGS
jgi:hypothetical protein